MTIQQLQMPPPISVDQNLIAAFTMANSTSGMTDYVIIIGDYKWKAHAQVLTTASRYFDKAIDGKFKESQTKQSVLQEKNVYDFARLLQFIYTGTFDYCCSESGQKRQTLLHALLKIAPPRTDLLEMDNARTKSEVEAGMWHMAQYYDVPALRVFLTRDAILTMRTTLDIMEEGVKLEISPFVESYTITYERLSECGVERQVMLRFKTEMAYIFVRFESILAGLYRIYSRKLDPELIDTLICEQFYARVDTFRKEDTDFAQICCEAYVLAYRSFAEDRQVYNDLHKRSRTTTWKKRPDCLI